jgi:hypothetical protein
VNAGIINLKDGFYVYSPKKEISLKKIQYNFKPKKDIIHPLARIIFNSTVETDRFQTYHWYSATPENPNLSHNGKYFVWETNFLTVSKNRRVFDKKVNVAKLLVNELPRYISDENTAKKIYYLITVGQLYNVIDNNITSKKNGYPRYVVLDLNYEF